MKKFKVYPLEEKELVVIRSYSSYIERPPHNFSEKYSATFIMRSFRGVKFITFGMNIYLMKEPELEPLLASEPRWRRVGLYNFPVIRLEEAFRHLNEEGREFSLALQKEWNDLTELSQFYQPTN